MKVCKLKQKKEIRHVQKYNTGFCSYFNIEYKGNKSVLYIRSLLVLIIECEKSESSNQYHEKYIYWSIL